MPLWARFTVTRKRENRACVKRKMINVIMYYIPTMNQTQEGWKLFWTHLVSNATLGKFLLADLVFCADVLLQGVDLFHQHLNFLFELILLVCKYLRFDLRLIQLWLEIVAAYLIVLSLSSKLTFQLDDVNLYIICIWKSRINLTSKADPLFALYAQFWL